jgi:hypothetical protein
MKKMLLGFVLLCGMVSSVFGNTPTEKFVPIIEPMKPPPQLFIGLTSGYGISIPSGEIANPFLKGQNFENASANTFFLGISGEFFLRRIDRPSDPASSIGFKIFYRNYSSMDNSFSQTEEKTFGSQTQRVETQYSTTYKTSCINFESLYSVYLYSSRFSVIAGPGFGFVINEELLKRVEIVQPSDFTFDENSFEGDYALEQNGRAAVLKSGNASGFQAYLRAGVQYSFFGETESSSSLRRPLLIILALRNHILLKNFA